MSSLWNLRNYEIFAHRGYDGTNTLESYTNAIAKGYHIEGDIVQTADGTVFMEHDRSTTDSGGNTVYVADMTDDEFRSYFPNQPTASEFIEFMLNNPNTLACISPYQGFDTFVVQCVNAGIDDRIMFDTTPSEERVRKYPRVSWCVPSTNITTNEELDEFRTPLNIVSSDECEDNSNGKFPILRQWSQCNVNTLPSLIAKGVTWFCPSANGTSLDDFAEALKEYTAPNYSNSFMINECAKALRNKNSEIGDIYGRNIPSEIRKLKTYLETDVATELNLKAFSTTIYPQILRGYIQSVKTVNIDENSINVAPANVQYVVFDQPCVINYSNIVSTAVMGDFLRQATNVKEVNFIGGYAPSGALTRWFYQFNTYPFDVDVVTDKLTVTGLKLDNVTAFNSLGSNGIELEILWEGTLNNSVNVSTATTMTSNSVSALINCLADYSSGEQHTLTLGTTLLALVSEEDLALATSRNWVLA